MLLDALEALGEQLPSTVVVGAQAAYLQTRSADVSVAPMTTDADLIIEPDRLSDSPSLAVLMTGNFDQALEDSGSPRPGAWLRNIEIDGIEIAVPVDLMVPSELAPPGGRRSVRLGVHGRLTARKVDGLVAAIVDNDLITVAALDPDDGRQIECRVAGPMALLIAKAHKIQDRADGSRQLNAKDASDAYRLMLSVPYETVAERLARLMDDPRTSEAVNQGVALLRSQFGARRSMGVEMAIESLRGVVPDERVRLVCTSFVENLQAEH